MIKKYLIPHRDNDYKPHVLRELSVGAILALSIAVFLLFSFILPRINQSSQLAEIYSAVLVASANNDRADLAALPSLTVNPLLEEAALMKAEDMAANGYFAHNSPQGLTPWYWIKKAGYNYLYAGENLAIDFSDSDDVEKAWLNSPTHRANILNGHYSEIGIATARGKYNGHSTTFVVQMFGSPKAAEVAVSTAPPVAPVATPVAGTQLKPKPAPKVLGAESNPPVKEVNTVVATTETAIAPVETSDISAPTSVQKLLTNPAKMLRVTYLIIIIFLLLALALFIFIEWRVQHPKNIAYALLLLVVISILLYINWLLFVTKIVIA